MRGGVGEFDDVTLRREKLLRDFGLSSLPPDVVRVGRGRVGAGDTGVTSVKPSTSSSPGDEHAGDEQVEDANG